MNNASLVGKVAVITGAGRGIGRSTALAFARAGADVALCARSRDELDAVATEVEEHGRRAVVMSVDVSVPDQVRAFSDVISDAFGGIDIIVNNAGAYLERGSFADSDPDLWWKTIEVNVRGPALLTRYLIGKINRGGKIINLTSGKGFGAGANSSAYHVSKAALNMFTACLANELWHRDIDVNGFVPGPTATATFDNARPGEERTPEEILSAGPDSLPKGLPAWERVKHPDEVAEHVLNLAAQPTGGPTGQVVSLARRPL